MSDRKKRRPGKKKADKDEKLKALYAESRRKFTAADLQKYTEIDEGIPFEKVIKECEEMLRKYKRKKA